MIPKIIHYCWFGRGEKSDTIKKCIQSWHDKLPDYQIIEWNEDNFDIKELRYSKEAYEARKYAFVSDVARVRVLYEYGGIYLDTDVEVFQSFDSILNHKCVLGFEADDYIATSFMASEPKNELFNQFYNLYVNEPFYKENGEYNQLTNVRKLTSMLEEKGLLQNGRYQELDDFITVYPMDYFSPYEYGYGVYKYTKSTICVHHFEVSWLPQNAKRNRKIKKILCLIFGIENVKKVRNALVKNR